MKNIFLSIILLISATVAGYGQDYKLNMNSGTLVFSEVSKLTIEGTSGNEVIFSSTGGKAIPERAAGLKPINSLGLQDNTGVGLSVKKTDGNYYHVSEVLRNSDSRYVVKVPKGVKVQVEQNSVHGSKIEIKDLSSDIEVSSRYSNVVLNNISGSALINSVHGDIEAIFIDLNKPVSIVSAHGAVDVTLPASTKGDIKMSSKFGDIFTDMDIKYDTNGDMRQITSTVSGKLNGGGGTEIFLESKHGNIYLRKK
ncbi:MAG: DUF4097 family beta strand repeat-containing protein [Candidatus Cyclobacteriaceae bacterium M2_1C_046]